MTQTPDHLSLSPTEGRGRLDQRFARNEGYAPRQLEFLEITVLSLQSKLTMKTALRQRNAGEKRRELTPSMNFREA